MKEGFLFHLTNNMMTNNRCSFQLQFIFPLQLVSLDGLHSGVPTRTTPTLTPTTLRSIEQTFLELTSESASHSREAGFVPPLVEPSQPTPAQTQNTTAVHHLPVPTTTTLVENQQQTQAQQQQPVRRNMGGRRPTRTIGMTPEEEERRQIRRERNKMAAARCRKRRMDHTNALLEVSVLSRIIAHWNVEYCDIMMILCRMKLYR